METRKATIEEQKAINQANLLFKQFGLEISELKGERGTVLPNKGF